VVELEYTMSQHSGKVSGSESMIGDVNDDNGFVDITDRPYAELVAASRQIGRDMYALRFE
jgi:hypothetical protein